MIGGLKHRIGGNSKVGCVLGIDFKKIGQGHGQSFMSHDVYGRICAITGAVWNLDGRSFDGVDDKVVMPTSIQLGTEDWSMETQLKETNLAQARYPIGWYDGAGDFCLLRALDVATFEIDCYFGGVRDNPIVPIAITNNFSYGIAITLDRDGDWKGYFNGHHSKTSAVTITTGSITFTNAFTLGRPFNDWNGHISKIRLKNSVDYAARILQRAIDSRRN